MAAAEHHHPHDHHPGHTHEGHAGHDHGHRHGGHSHGHGAGERQLLIALCLTAAFMLGEAAGGWLAGSLALLADAAHMLADVVALGMSYAAIRVARRPATAALTYGHHRWQVLAAFVNGLALLALSVWIGAAAALRLLTQPAVHAPTMIWIGALGVAVNLLSYRVLAAGERNLNVRSALLHVASDVLGNLAAALAGAVILWSGWTPVDPILSALMALLIVRGGWRVTRESAHILLEGAPTELELEQTTRELLAAVPEVRAIHHVHAWSLSEARIMMTLHAVLAPDADGDAAIARIAQTLRERAKVEHVTVQIERDACVPADHAQAC